MIPIRELGLDDYVVTQEITSSSNINEEGTVATTIIMAERTLVEGMHL